MTLKEARKNLKGKLVFGDVEQIHSVKFIAHFEDAKEFIINCESFRSHMRIDTFENEWPAIEIRECCECCSKIPESFNDAIVAALRSLKNEHRK